VDGLGFATRWKAVGASKMGRVYGDSVLLQLGGEAMVRSVQRPRGLQRYSAQN